MTLIWKFVVEPFAPSIKMPRGARLLHVAGQNGEVCVWAEVEQAQPLVERRIVGVGTGIRARLADGATYIGTAHTAPPGGPLVIHVYDEGEVA